MLRTVVVYDELDAATRDYRRRSKPGAVDYSAVTDLLAVTPFHRRDTRTTCGLRITVYTMFGVRNVNPAW
jgi:hypothetical protein